MGRALIAMWRDGWRTDSLGRDRDLGVIGLVFATTCQDSCAFLALLYHSPEHPPVVTYFVDAWDMNVIPVPGSERRATGEQREEFRGRSERPQRYSEAPHHQCTMTLAMECHLAGLSLVFASRILTYSMFHIPRAAIVRCLFFRLRQS